MTRRSLTVEYFPPANKYPWRAMESGSGPAFCAAIATAAVIRHTALRSFHFMTEFLQIMMNGLSQRRG